MSGRLAAILGSAFLVGLMTGEVGAQTGGFARQWSPGQGTTEQQGMDGMAPRRGDRNGEPAGDGRRGDGNTGKAISGGAPADGMAGGGKRVQREGGVPVGAPVDGKAVGGNRSGGGERGRRDGGVSGGAPGAGMAGGGSRSGGGERGQREGAIPFGAPDGGKPGGGDARGGRDGGRSAGGDGERGGRGGRDDGERGRRDGGGDRRGDRDRDHDRGPNPGEIIGGIIGKAIRDANRDDDRDRGPRRGEFHHGGPGPAPWIRGRFGREFPRGRFEDWEELGCVRVSRHVDSDYIDVGRQEGRFSAIVLRASGADIAIDELRVVYGNGEPDRLRVRSVLGEGMETRAIDLEGFRRSIDHIELTTQRDFRWGRRPARLCVFGLRYFGPDRGYGRGYDRGPRRRDDGWVDHR